MFPHTVSHNLRLIALTMRDYPGSSGYTQSEVESFTTPDPIMQEAMIRGIGGLLAGFLLHIIHDLQILPITVSAEGGRKGGLALVAWSMGSTLR